jgi:predicted nucleotidyltransferase
MAHQVSPKLPASGLASKMALMKFLDPDTEGAVRDFLARIPADIRLERAILFGCRARGEHRPDSDADLALILHERGNDGQTLMMLAGLAWYVFLDTGIMGQFRRSLASRRSNRYRLGFPKTSFLKSACWGLSR